MKRIILSALTLMATIGLSAAEVPQNALRQAAVNFWNTYRPATMKAIGPTDLQAVSVDGMTHLGIYVMGEEGFVILADDDRVRPVLAYSFDSPFPAVPHPSLQSWLANYEAQIDYVSKQAFAAPAWVSAEWDKLLNGTVPPVPLTLVNVPALCSTRWNQSDMGNTYNRLCPFDSTYNERTVVGCVATAMAQIMKYWNHPSHGVGSHTYTPVTWPGYDTLYGTLSADFGNTTYQWEYMPNYLNVTSAPHQINAVATLSYHCGVAVDMMYGPSSTGGSGAYTISWGDEVPGSDVALRDYFRYNESLHGEYRSNYDSATWAGMIEADLEAGRPILYTGDDNTSGHAFVLDGSDLQNRYHFNWGWGGDGDGFYAIDNMAPGGGGAGGNATYTFNEGHSAIFSIFPNPETFDTIDFYDTICDNVSEYTYYNYEFDAVDGDYQVRHLDTVVNLHVKVIQEKHIYIYSNSPDDHSQQRQDFCPVDSIIVPECTFEREGYAFHHWTLNYVGNGQHFYPGQRIKRSGNFSLYAQWVSADDTIGGMGIAQTLDDAVALGPNPTKDIVSVDAPAGAKITLFDAMGRIIATKTATDGKVDFDLTDQAAGMFTVQVRTEKGVCNKRVIKQ